jgi:hypothetical protein
MTIMVLERALELFTRSLLQNLGLRGRLKGIGPLPSIRRARPLIVASSE